MGKSDITESRVSRCLEAYSDNCESCGNDAVCPSHSGRECCLRVHRRAVSSSMGSCNLWSPYRSYGLCCERVGFEVDPFQNRNGCDSRLCGTDYSGIHRSWNKQRCHCCGSSNKCVCARRSRHLSYQLRRLRRQGRHPHIITDSNRTLKDPAIFSQTCSSDSSSVSSRSSSSSSSSSPLPFASSSSEFILDPPSLRFSPGQGVLWFCI